MNNLGDISNISSDVIPDFDLFNISFPCQSFSVAGKRLGINDFRGTLGFVSLELLRKKQPKYFMIENVPGLVSIDDGNVLKSMLEIIHDCGYEVAIDLINGKDLGVPQNRLRLFCLGRRIDNE